MKHQVQNRICEAMMCIGALKGMKRQDEAKRLDTTEIDNEIAAWEATIEDLRKSCI